MMRVGAIRISASTALRLGLLAGMIATAGCSDSASGDKKDDPALKASMQKAMEIYKTKSQTKKGNSASPRQPH